MIKIDYPDHPYRIKTEKGREMIFDETRKIWLLLTPEEWVRQNFVRFLITVKKYPPSLIALEKKIVVGELPKRFDVLVYNTRHEPWMLVECKSMDVPLSEDTLAQVLRYHIAVPVQYLIITNGTSCMAFGKDHMHLVPLNEVPSFE